MTITDIDPNFSISVWASLIAWLISSTITGLIGYFIKSKLVKRRYEKMLNKSISGTTKAISTVNLRMMPEKGAATIIKEFDIHTSNYNSIKHIVSNEQIEKIKWLLKQKEPDKHKIAEEVSDLKKTWDSYLTAMYRAQANFDKELGFKK